MGLIECFYKNCGNRVVRFGRISTQAFDDSGLAGRSELCDLGGRIVVPRISQRGSHTILIFLGPIRDESLSESGVLRRS